MTDFMFSGNDTTPVWVGWNAKYSPENKTTQKIWYLPQINQCPTLTSVVAETMRRSLRIASESQKENISVTYNFTIACPRVMNILDVHEADLVNYQPIYYCNI